jgi:hypothetical protein
LTLLANYTFSKNLSNAPDFRSPMFEASIPQNNNNLPAEKGPACDVRHRFALSAVYDVPALNRVNLGTPNRFVNTPQFGAITEAATPGREIQFSARVPF